MRYSVVLAKRIYEELRDSLPEPRGAMGEHLHLVVDDQGREVIEARLPGRIRWDAVTIPRTHPTSRGMRPV
jgi:hypothetical protein